MFVKILALATLLPLAAAASENQLPNGSFEEGMKGWSHEEWKGLPLPGRIGTEKPFEGKQYFILTEPGNMTPRFIRSANIPVTRGKNYVLKFALAGEEIKKGTVSVRVLQYGAPENKKTPVLGWVTPGRPGVNNFFSQPLEGTFDWRTFEVAIPGSALHADVKTIAIYVQNQEPSFGELAVDAVQFTEQP